MSNILPGVPTLMSYIFKMAGLRNLRRRGNAAANDEIQIIIKSQGMGKEYFTGGERKMATTLKLINIQAERKGESSLRINITENGAEEKNRSSGSRHQEG